MEKLMSGSPLQAQVFQNLAICYDLYSQRLERVLRPLGLNMTAMHLLTHFSWRPERSWTISELVQVMGIHQPGITKATKAMCDKGWMRREQDEQDARIKHLFITEEGLAVLSQAQVEAWPELEAGFQCFNVGELSQFLPMLQKLKVQLEKLRS
jgi:DNA-binding MarR family transcriptional regulator